MIFAYEVEHSHGMASGSIEAISEQAARDELANLYEKEFQTADIERGKDGELMHLNERNDKIEITNIKLVEIT
jgi:hypothetical protein